MMFLSRITFFGLSNLLTKAKISPVPNTLHKWWQYPSIGQLSRGFYSFPFISRHTNPWSMMDGSLPLHGSCLRIPCRTVVKVSRRRGKMKTVKAVAKRFYRTGSGKLKYWPSGHVHNMLAKSFNRRRDLRKPRYASKIQMKTLNKMINGW